MVTTRGTACPPRGSEAAPPTVAEYAVHWLARQRVRVSAHSHAQWVQQQLGHRSIGTTRELYGWAARIPRPAEFSAAFDAVPRRHDPLAATSPGQPPTAWTSAPRNSGKVA
jgi:hypothetical protein